ncbi:MAG TPA: HEPN domain-containing protein [Deinococcales bacterium]|nr:HEPN domain-containing protein [Deinococcales bacterium]
MADSREVREWVQYAEEDWLLALRGLEDLRSSAVHLLHQASEKYLKAVLLQEEDTLVRTHDLGVLVNALPGEGDDRPELVEAAILMNAALEASRYPRGASVPDDQETAAILEAARTLRSFARSRLGLPD